MRESSLEASSLGSMMLQIVVQHHLHCLSQHCHTCCRAAVPCSTPDIWVYNTMRMPQGSKLLSAKRGQEAKRTATGQVLGGEELGRAGIDDIMPHKGVWIPGGCMEDRQRMKILKCCGLQFANHVVVL